jgi:hypothetical protein
MKTIDEMLSHFMEIRFSPAEILHCFVEELPKRIKRGIKPMNIYYFLMHATK